MNKITWLTPTDGAINAMTKTIYATSLTIAGAVRRLLVDRYMHADNHKAVVMLGGFVENGYWYQIPLEAYSLAQSVAALGYDVHVLSFLPEVKAAKSPHMMVDASFDEVVSQHLPAYHHALCQSYKQIHYIGHSYGATLLLAFLLGYQRTTKPNASASFSGNKATAKANQRRVISAVSLAGYFGIDIGALLPRLPGNLQTQLPSSHDDIVNQIEWLVGLLYKRGLNRFLPFIPTHRLATLRYVPGVQRLLTLTNLFSPAFFPFVFLPNTHLPAFHKALAHGSSLETWENLLTLLSLSDSPARSEAQALRPHSKALTAFTTHLQDFRKPICFIQGDKDMVTSPAMIESQAYARVGSRDKQLTNLINFGHQDLFTAKNPRILPQHLNEWLANF